MTRLHRDKSLADLVVSARSLRRSEHEEAFREIVRRFHGHAHASAFRLLRDAHLAQDVAQEAFLEAYLELAQLRDPAAFPGWFRRILFKQADRIRRRPTHVPLEASVLEGRPAAGVSPEEFLAAREEIAWVRDALVGLPEHERDAVVLFYFSHRSHVEIGEHLGVPVSTVKKRLHDARQRLRLPLATRDAAKNAPPRDAPTSGAAPMAPGALRGADALQLARQDNAPARAALRQIEPAMIAAAVQELTAKDRVAFLEASERLPEIVPCLPEVTLVQTIRRVGLDEAGWIIEFASPEQRVAALDLDCWQDRHLSPGRFLEWVDALIEAGTDALLAAFDDVDVELWILILHWMAEFSIPGHLDSDAEDDPWHEDDPIAAEGSTDDGVVFYSARSADHDERIHTLLRTARIYTPSLYWDFVYGVINEPPKSCEATAARWQQGRLNDLGFPEISQAMKIYQPLSAESVPRVECLSPPPANATPVPATLSGTALGHALAELPADRASEIQAELFTLANAVAVADRQPLAEAEALERSLRKAVAGVDLGLAAIAKRQNRPFPEVADTTSTRKLFRVGISVRPELRPSATLGELEDRENRSSAFDWDVAEEWIGDSDQTLRSDGSIRG